MGSKSFRIQWLLSLLILSMLLSCGGGGGGTAAINNGSGPLPPVPGTGGSEGSIASPIHLSLNTTRDNSIVGSIDDSYYTFTTAGAGSYSISLTNTSTALQWDLYSDASFSTPVSTSCYNWMSSAADVRCVVALNASIPYYVKVSSRSFSSGTFSITPAEIVSEGTTTAPVELIVGQTHAGSINANGTSYYKFKTTKAGSFTVSYANWDIAGAGTVSIGTKIFKTDFSSANQLVSCGGSQWLITNCTANGLDADTYYYVEMSQNAGNDVRLDITVTEGVSQGTAANPVPLMLGTVQGGAVDGYGDSYYTFTTTAAGSYLFTKTGDMVDISIYSDPSYSNLTASYGYSSTVNGQVYTLSGLEPGKQYYVRVYGSYSTDASFTLLVQSGITEGSVNVPVKLTPGSPHTASIDANGTAYYYFTPSMSGTVEINLTSSLNAQWVLAADAQFTQNLYTLGTYNIACKTTEPSNGNCTTTNLDYPSTYYLKVTNNSASSGSFTVTLTEGTGSEGSPNTPVILTMGTPFSGRTAAGVDNNGFVTPVSSYYKFTPPTSDQLLIMVKNFSSGGSGDVIWDLYAASVPPNPPYSNSVLGCYKWATGSIYSNDAVCTTANFQPAIVITANNEYFLEVTNNKAVKNGYTILIVPYSSALGCNGGGSCLTFDTMPPTVASDPSFTFINPSTDWNGNTLDYNGKPVVAWISNANTPTGSGSSIQSGQPTISGADKFPSWTSCFQITATNIKWLSFSVNTQVNAGTNDSLVFYVDNNEPAYQASWSGNTAWKRMLYSDTTVGLHTYKWCYSKGNTVDNASVGRVDDIELNY